MDKLSRDVFGAGKVDLVSTPIEKLDSTGAFLKTRMNREALRIYGRPLSIRIVSRDYSRDYARLDQEATTKLFHDAVRTLMEMG